MTWNYLSRPPKPKEIVETIESYEERKLSVIVEGRPPTCYSCGRKGTKNNVAAPCEREHVSGKYSNKDLELIVTQHTDNYISQDLDKEFAEVNTRKRV